MEKSASKKKFEYDIVEEIPDEERKGLLSDDNVFESEPKALEHGPRRRLAWMAIGLIVLLLTGSTTLHYFLTPAPPSHHTTGVLLSNGTHEFKRTVLLVSIDGLRADYLDRGLTPHLLAISKKGLRAKYMTPIFPTLTFPNHWSLMTGLYAESHGIVANNFWDPVSKSEFHYNQVESCWNASWWSGEPMWETAENANIISANLMWPGPPRTTTGVSSSYFVPWRDHVPLGEKLEQIIEWIDLPLEQRPQMILAYEPSLDQAGHLTGPMSSLRTLAEVDVFARDLHTQLEERNLTDIVDIIFVSDHGMTDTSHPEMVYMDDILGSDGLTMIEHEDGWPSMGMRFSSSANESFYLNILLEAAAASPEKFDVYTHETMPERYHFADNERIAPIYVVPKIGYALTTRADGDVGMSKGNHGYDNAAPSMHAIFVAHGPFSAVTKALQQSKSSSLLRRILSRPNKGWHSTADDTFVMQGFQNVELYNLVLKLLGIEKSAASNNGTAGFWDQYF